MAIVADTLHFELVSVEVHDESWAVRKPAVLFLQWLPMRLAEHRYWMNEGRTHMTSPIETKAVAASALDVIQF